MEFMARDNDRGGGKVNLERKIKRLDLRDGILACRPMRTEYDERITEASSVGVCMDWPPFDFHVCRFELKQWLNACDTELAAYRPLCSLVATFQQNAIQTAIVAKTNKSKIQTFSTSIMPFFTTNFIE